MHANLQLSSFLSSLNKRKRFFIYNYNGFKLAHNKKGLKNIP